MNLNLINNQYSDIEYTIVNMPDGHKHLDLSKSKYKLSNLIDVFIVTRLTNLDDLFIVMQAVNALRYENKDVRLQLKITYLLGARYDRRMYENDSFDLEIITKLINDMNFYKVGILEPHSNISTTLIKNSYAVSPIDFRVKSYIEKFPVVDGVPCGSVVMVAPDLGAVKRVEQFIKYTGRDLPIVILNKTRNLKTGEITGMEILKGGDLTGKTCVIYDDLCDGGRTFTEAAKLLRHRGSKDVVLAVTHGIFSQGFQPLMTVKEDGGYLNFVITSNSYKDISDEIGIHVVNVTQ